MPLTMQVAARRPGNHSISFPPNHNERDDQTRCVAPRFERPYYKYDHIYNRVADPDLLYFIFLCKDIKNEKSPSFHGKKYILALKKEIIIAE